MPLFYDYGFFWDRQNYLNIIFQNSEEFDELDFNFRIELVTENDIFDHNNKNNPIIPLIYKYENHFFPNISIEIDYRLDFIKYETDNGCFFKI